MNDNNTAQPDAYAQMDASIIERKDAAVAAFYAAVEASADLHSGVPQLWRDAAVAYLRLGIAVRQRHGSYSGNTEMQRVGEMASLCYWQAENYGRIVDGWLEFGSDEDMNVWLKGSAR